MLDTNIDPDLHPRFLKLLDPHNTGVLYQTFQDRKSAEKDGSLTRITTDQAALPDLHARGAGIYATVNQTDGTGRKSQNITHVRAVWREADDPDLPALPIEPSMVIETSPGHRHEYFLVQNDWPADEQGRADFASIMERMVETYGSDKNAKDISRVLRVPGFLHRKDSPPHLVRIVAASVRRYSRQELLAAFPPVAKAAPTPSTSPAVSAPQRGDYSRACDALAFINADDREEWLTCGMAIKDHFGDHGRGLWDDWSRKSDKFDEKDQERTWRSLNGGGTSLATLFYRAQKGGYVPIEVAEYNEALLRLPERGDKKTNGGLPAVDVDADYVPLAPDALSSVCAAEVKMKPIQWLWPERFAIGKLGIIAGLPDVGKGQILASIAAAITTGGHWPCNEGSAPKGRVVLLSGEDDLEDTVVPRLAAAGADLTRVRIAGMVVRNSDNKKKRMFSLITDLEKLEQTILEVGDVRVILIDPITAYMGVKQIDSFRINDVRAVLAPVVEMAARLGISIISVMHFNKKTDETNALLRISDSLAYGATARHVYAAIDDAENKRKLFVKAKNNLARYDQQSLAYHLTCKFVGPDLNIIGAYIEWEPQPVTVTATEAMQAATSSAAPKALSSAIEFLEKFLADGPRYRDDVTDAAEASMITDHTLRRAKDQLQIISEKEKVPNGRWQWRLPPFVPKPHWTD